MGTLIRFDEIPPTQHSVSRVHWWSNKSFPDSNCAVLGAIRAEYRCPASAEAGVCANHPTFLALIDHE